MVADAKRPFLAFAQDAQDIAVLKQFAGSHGWADDSVLAGDIATATEHLRSHKSPQILLVEIPTAAEAPKLLDGLAEFCDPGTKVIVIGNINEYSFYCWLTDIGIFSYLLRPLSQAALDGAYAKSNEHPRAAGAPEKAPATFIAMVGARGGVGNTTLSINLAGLIAENSALRVALVDGNPYDGSASLLLDVEPSRGYRDALEKPERIDSLFIDRVTTRVNERLSILSAEESLQDKITIDPGAADALTKELSEKFDVVIMDIAHPFNEFTEKCLEKADHIILVAEMTLLSLRDTLRYGDLMRDALKLKPPILLANRVGMAPKYETKPADFEKGVNLKVAYTIPFAPEVFMQTSTEIGVLKLKTHAASKLLMQLAQQLLPQLAPAGAKDKKGGKPSKDSPDKKGK